LDGNERNSPRGPEQQAASSPSDNFEAWLRIREELVFEIAHPGTLMHTMFQPTCGVIYVGLSVSLVYVIFRIFMDQAEIGVIAFSQIFQLATSGIYAVAIFTITHRIQRLINYQAEGIAGLELEISKSLFDVERSLQDSTQARTSSMLNELRSFYRLVQVANNYLQAAPAQPKVLGFNITQWIWVGLFTAGILLNALFVIASFNEEPTAGSITGNNTGTGYNRTASVPGFCNY